jgi:catechol 2,3-dioxygenase-like lactoylglutathione lyase family enzyme
MHFKPAIFPLLLCVFLPVFFFQAITFAQLTPANESGVTIGHIHLFVPDPEAHRKLWTGLFGAQVDKTGALEVLKLPGIDLLISKGQPANAAGEPTADHFALVVRDFTAVKSKLAAANIQMLDGKIAAFPDGVKVEFIEDKNLGVPVAFHHIHIFTADADALRDWYVKTFGRVKFTDGPNYPGGQIYFTSQLNPPRVPTKGLPLDHISFEIKDLEEFCKKLKAEGTKLDMNISDPLQIGLKYTFITDPVGTRIQSTERYAGK